MAKLDRLGWAAGISLVAFGRRIGIRTTNRDVLDQLVPMLPPGSQSAKEWVVEQLYSLVVAGPSPRPNVQLLNVLYSGSARVARSRELSEVLEALENDL